MSSLGSLDHLGVGDIVELRYSKWDHGMRSEWWRLAIIRHTSGDQYLVEFMDDLGTVKTIHQQDRGILWR